MPKALAVVAVTAAAAIAALSPSAATAATPCWQKVIKDWRQHNGAIQGHYSPHCLRQAIKNMYEDLRDYTPIIDDINALLDDAAGAGSSGSGFGGSGGGDNGQVPGPGMDSKTQAKERERQAAKAVPGIGTKQSIPDSSRSIPLPLILLGALGLAAGLATAAPPAYRRLHGRFPRLRGPAESVRPPS